VGIVGGIVGAFYDGIEKACHGTHPPISTFATVTLIAEIHQRAKYFSLAFA
jgi:hypothetical protein